MPLNPKFENLLKTDFESLYSLGVEKFREYYSKSWDDFKEIPDEVGSVVTTLRFMMNPPVATLLTSRIQVESLLHLNRW
ncbi:hypothetical protein [Sporomusa acidovorans]|uniref:Uncharacterized protein n=1 Tax=Sporomusa acidovorans (strain ATCC 49682 / DSM 3132 / Mol) TaxID=1123286 RepID=A0ABZ3J5E2_SPOA4|nr:hypothetical protein [Sporomusa acidovorans]OZC18281.1 hypothetical protein SPACI_35550 [Sporomusa acidovorans DSM 3132]SDF26496.1 hypothetical protein SAMN04488499_104055 [Sporomusa acidovorans]